VVGKTALRLPDCRPLTDTAGFIQNLIHVMSKGLLAQQKRLRRTVKSSRTRRLEAQVALEPETRDLGVELGLAVEDKVVRLALVVTFRRDIGGYREAPTGRMVLRSNPPAGSLPRGQPLHRSGLRRKSAGSGDSSSAGVSSIRRWSISTSARRRSCLWIRRASKHEYGRSAAMTTEVRLGLLAQSAGGEFIVAVAPAIDADSGGPKRAPRGGPPIDPSLRRYRRGAWASRGGAKLEESHEAGDTTRHTSAPESTGDGIVLARINRRDSRQRSVSYDRYATQP